MSDKMTTKEFIGERLYHQYSDLFPIIRLFTYTMDAMGFSDNAIRDSLLAYDRSIDDYNHPISKLAVLLGIPGYYCKKMFNLNKHSTILVSGRLRKLGRYRELQKAFQEDSRVSGIATYGVPLFLKRSFGKSSERNIGQNIFLGESVAGKNLKKYVAQLYVVLTELYKSENSCESRYDEVSCILEKIRTIKEKRIGEIEKEFKRSHIKLFVTQNQYNLADLMIIEVCRNLNIRTAEWQHHHWNLFPIAGKEFTNNEKKKVFYDNQNLLTFTDELWLWTDADERWINKNKRVEKVFGQNLKLIVGGSPEIDEKTILLNKERYKKKNVLTVMVPWNVDNSVDFERRKDKLVGEVIQLSKRFDFGVYLRFHPSDKVGEESGKKYCTENRIMIVESTQQALDKCLSESRIIFGSTSSVMILAYNYGLRTICVDLYDDNEYDFNSDDFEHMSIEDIKRINIEEAFQDHTGKDSYKYDKLFEG